MSIAVYYSLMHVHCCDAELNAFIVTLRYAVLNGATTACGAINSCQHCQAVSEKKRSVLSFFISLNFISSSVPSLQFRFFEYAIVSIYYDVKKNYIDCKLFCFSM